MNNTIQNNDYQAMNIYQKPVFPEQPIMPKPQYSAEDVYNASNGNLITTKDGEIQLTPQGELNLLNAQNAKTEKEDAQVKAQKDAQREYAAGYINYKSKQTQAEIYLSVAIDDKVELSSGTSDIIKSLRDVQKQNNIVEAYATYKENQIDIKPTPYI